MTMECYKARTPGRPVKAISEALDGFGILTIILFVLLVEGRF
jgi:hypothetical protein